MGKEASEKGAGAREQGEIDALFRLAPPEYVAARNALAARLKKDGRADIANRVRSLPKPSISAWTVNQLYWKHRAAFEMLIATGERFRQAQVSRLTGHGPDIRGLLNERREALSAMSRLAAEILQTSSGSSPAGVMRRITATLEALSSYGTLTGAPQAGRLVEDVDPPGFEALAALVPRVGDSAKRAEPSRVLAFQKQAPSPPARKADARQDAHRREQQRQARLATARVARKKATQALVQARGTAKKAQALLKLAATRVKDAEKGVAAAERRLQQVTSAAHEAKQRARRAAVDAETATQAVEEAEVALTRATQELDTLGASSRS